jgi:hypothetical protein
VLIEPAPEDLFEPWPVSRDVNRTINDNSGLIAPVVPGAEQPPRPKTAASRPRPKPGKTDDGQGVLF